MGVNRFMTPAELPKVSFFQLPYEQMKEGIMAAQQQQDVAREGLSQIGDISFNYLTNSKVDPELAKNVYGELDQKTQGVLSKQGNGDLRGLRGEIYNLGKEVGRWYKPDGKIGRLQSNYLQYNDWYKRQVENKELDPKYIQDAAKAIIDEYDSKGGANAGGIYTEDLKKHFDYSKFVNDNKDMIKSTIIQRERDRLGNNGYKYTDEQLQKFITPEKIMYTLSDILQSNPDHLSSLQQRIRFGNLPKESQSTLIQTGKDDKGQPIYGLNPYSPAAGAIQGAMRGLGGMEEDRQRHSIGNDEGYWKQWEQSQKEKELPGTPGQTESVVKYDPKVVKQVINSVTGGDASAIPNLIQLQQPNIQNAKQTFLTNTGEVKPQYKKEFSKWKDLKGNSINPSDMVEAIGAGTYINIFGNPEVDPKAVRKILESKNYKVDYNSKEDGYAKAARSAVGLYGDNNFDIPGLTAFVTGYSDNAPSSSSPINKYYLPTAKKFHEDYNQQTSTTLSKPTTVVSQGSKMFSEFQDPKQLGIIAANYNAYDEQTGQYLQTLDKHLGDKENPVTASNIEYSTDTPVTPGATADNFVTLQYKDGTIKKVRIEGRTPQMIQDLNQRTNSYETQSTTYRKNMTNTGVAGTQSKVTNVIEGYRKLQQQDLNTNQKGLKIVNDMFSQIATSTPSTRTLSSEITFDDGSVFKGKYRSLPTGGSNGKYKLELLDKPGQYIYFNTPSQLQQILTEQ